MTFRALSDGSFLNTKEAAELPYVYVHPLPALLSVDLLILQADCKLLQQGMSLDHFLTCNLVLRVEQPFFSGQCPARRQKGGPR